MATKMQKPKRCAIKKCKEQVTTLKYCRLHYIAHAQDRFNREALAKEQLLDTYIVAITKKYPDRYLEIIKRDLSDADRFKKTLKELHISNDLDTKLVREYREVLHKIEKGKR